MENKYIIKGGEEGKKRLNVLAEILSESTENILIQNGATAGKSFLDVGCGGGNVSLLAAKLVGHSGQVTAIDFDAEIIDLAKKDAQDLGIQNISYKALDAHEMDFENEFDMAYSRFLLTHLQKPQIVLAKMIQATKPGGCIMVEDIDFSGHFCFPRSPAFAQYLNYFVAAATHNGHNPNIGLSLFDMFGEAGIQNIKFDVIQPCFNEGSGKWMAYKTLEKIKDAVITQGLASEAAFENTLAALKSFTEDKSTIMSLPRIFRIWGTKL